MFVNFNRLFLIHPDRYKTAVYTCITYKQMLISTNKKMRVRINRKLRSDPSAPTAPVAMTPLVDESVVGWLDPDWPYDHRWGAPSHNGYIRGIRRQSRGFSTARVTCEQVRTCENDIRAYICQ